MSVSAQRLRGSVATRSGQRRSYEAEEVEASFFPLEETGPTTVAAAAAVVAVSEGEYHLNLKERRKKEATYRWAEAGIRAAGDWPGIEAVVEWSGPVMTTIAGVASHATAVVEAG